MTVRFRLHLVSLPFSASYVCLVVVFYNSICSPAELQAGFVNSEYSLGEGEQVSICVVLEGYVERPVDDIIIHGEWSSVNGILLVFERALNHILQ